MLKRLIWALIWQSWRSSGNGKCLDVASQCKGNGLIEIFAQVFATGRQKYLMADTSTLEGHRWEIRQFWVNDVGWWRQPPCLPIALNNSEILEKNPDNTFNTFNWDR